MLRKILEWAVDSDSLRDIPQLMQPPQHVLLHRIDVRKHVVVGTDFSKKVVRSLQRKSVQDSELATRFGRSG